VQQIVLSFIGSRRSTLPPIVSHLLLAAVYVAFASSDHFDYFYFFFYFIRFSKYGSYFTFE